jgi:hypothetical protein
LTGLAGRVSNPSSPSIRVGNRTNGFENPVGSEVGPLQTVAASRPVIRAGHFLMKDGLVQFVNQNAQNAHRFIPRHETSKTVTEVQR